MSTTRYNNIATITGTPGTDFTIDSGILYILNSVPKLTFDKTIQTPLTYQNGTGTYTAPDGYYGNIVGFYVLVGQGGSGDTSEGGGGGGGGIVIQNNYPFFNNGTYSFQVGTYSNKIDTTLSFTPKDKSLILLYTAETGSNGGAGGAGGAGGSGSNGTNVYQGIYIYGAGGGNGSFSDNGLDGGQGVHLSDHGAPLDIWCSAGGGGASFSGRGGNAGTNGGGGGGEGINNGSDNKGSNSQDYTTKSYGGGGGGGGGYFGNPGKNGVIIIYATCYQYSLKQTTTPSQSGYTVNGIPLGNYFLPKTTNTAPITNYKYNGNDLNTIFEGYPNEAQVATTTVTNMTLTKNNTNVDIANFFQPQPSLVITSTSGNAYFLKTTNYYIYYFINNSSFNYTGSNDLYAVIVGGGGGSGGIYANITCGSGGGGGGGISMCKYNNTQGSILSLTFTCGLGGAFAPNGTGFNPGEFNPGEGGIGGTSILSGGNSVDGTPTANGGSNSASVKDSNNPSSGGNAGTTSLITLPTGVCSYGLSSKGSSGVYITNTYPDFPTGFTLQIESQLFFLASGGQGGYNSISNIINIPNYNFGTNGQQAIFLNTWGSGYGGEIDKASNFDGLNGTGSGASGQRGCYNNDTLGSNSVGGTKGGNGCCIVFFKNN